MSDHQVSLPHASRILITGATGFIGIHLLHELVSNCSAQIVCLIRAEDEDEARDKLVGKPKFFDLETSAIANRVSIVTGDLSKPQFGIESRQFDELCHDIDLVFHVGATNNWFMPFSRLEPINVAGTARIVEFARRVKIKTLHHVSSTAVFMSLDAHKLGYLGRAHPLSQYQRHVIGYFESKWAAEILVQEAFDNGLPGTIHRPSFVGGALHSGYLPKADLTHHFLISCIELGALPDLDLLIDIVPVDVLVKAILNLAIRSEHKRRDYNLCNPGGIPLSGLRDLAAEFGVKLKLLPYSDWLLELKADPPSPSKQIIAMFCKPVPGAEDGVFAHLSKAQRLDPVNIDTEDALAGSGIDCPPVDWKMLGSYLGAIAPNQNLL